MCWDHQSMLSWNSAVSGSCDHVNFRYCIASCANNVSASPSHCTSKACIDRLQHRVWSPHNKPSRVHAALLRPAALHCRLLPACMVGQQLGNAVAAALRSFCTEAQQEIKAETLPRGQETAICGSRNRRCQRFGSASTTGI